MEKLNDMNNEESIRIIQGMISSVKKNLEKDSFYYLIWGWLVFIASVANYILIKINYESPEIVWLLMPIGGVITYIYSLKQSKEQQVKTYVSEFMKYVLLAFGISLMIVLFQQNKFGANTYSIVLMLYGILLFISGGAINFKPFIVGGIINWIFAIGCLYVSFEIQLLFVAASTLGGYIIHGHLLNKLEKN
jgi:hypothetical protein